MALEKKLLDNYENWLPSDLQSPDGWAIIVPSLLDPWYSAYQTLVVESLGPFIWKMGNSIIADQNRIAYVFDINNPNSLKSWSSVADKICRNLQEFLIDHTSARLPKGVPEDMRDRASDFPAMRPEDFVTYFLKPMEDVARCRVLCNYNSDLDDLDKQIQTEFIPLAEERNAKWRDGLRRDKRLESGYSFKKGAHRAVHEYFEVKVDGTPQDISCLIEIQLMTLLQQAWDIKQHVLYEKIRILGFSSVCFIFASSESEDRMFGKHAKALDELIRKIEVLPLCRADAELLLEELVYCTGLTPRSGDVEAACDLIGEFVPYFIHAFAAAWQEADRRSSSPEDITPVNIYHDELLGLTGWNLFREIVDLPAKYTEPRPRGARYILDRLSACESEQESRLREQYGKSGTEEGFEDVLDRLSDDMLIARIEDQGIPSFRFYSKLLKDFWKRYPT